MKKLTFLLCFFISFMGYAQTEQPSKQHKFGVGLGYNFNSVIGDSIRPVELSLRYRVNDKHTLHLYAPLSFKKTSIHNADDTRKQTLYGIGIGYDYTFYTYSHLDFFAGLSADYQWYQNRWDFHRTYDIYEGAEFQYKKEDIYFYWDKARGVTLAPHLGFRFSTHKVGTELNLNLGITKLLKESYSFFKTRNVSHEQSWATWEAFYPERRRDDLIIESNVKISLFYFF